MASFIDMSLDDIIQKKKKEKIRIPKTSVAAPKKNIPPKKKLPITDARNKIISKKRTQIKDARDKLAELAKQKDARLKLEKLRLEKLLKRKTEGQGQGRPVLPYHRRLTRTVQNKEIVFGDPTRQVAYQPTAGVRNPVRKQLHTKKFLESRSIGTKNQGRPFQLKPIIRTVENDIEIIDDPMGEDYDDIVPKPSLLNRKASLQLKIIAHNNDVLKNRSTGLNVHRTAISEPEMSPPRPPSILKKRPMAALRSEQIGQKPEEKPAMEYRIIVSNLRNTVTGGDIEELFGDIGGMLESRLVRPGTAEVIYKTHDDAQKAVELYHNRQLDGQPMNCLLVTPRTQPIMQRNSSKPELFSSNSNVEPDISTFHKVLFSNV